jgi:type IV pilus assembly protein PilW
MIRQATHHNSGFTLVELMVALVIGMIVSLAATTAMITFNTAQKRDVGEDTAVEDSAIFLFSIAHEVKNAGVSPVDFDNSLVCTQFNFSSTDGTLLDGVPIYPVQITDGGDTGSDQISIAYTSTILGRSGTFLVTDMTAASADLVVGSSAGFNVGDTITVGALGAGSPCTIMQISSITAVGANSDLAHAAASTFPYNAADPAATFTTAPAYPAGSLVVGSGGFSYLTYQIGADGLQLRNNLTTPAQSSVIADTVVFMKAQYGISPGPGQPMQWVSAATAPWNNLTPTLVSQLRSVHIGLVVRNSQRVQPTQHGGPCDATVKTGVGSAGDPYLWQPNGPTVDLAAALGPTNPDWACYKYRTFDLVIPLKNAMFI